MENDPRSHGLWEKTAAEDPETQPLNRDMSVDVAIVGGGYTGLSAALHLAQAGAKVALLEAVKVGFGGAGRNVGLVNAGMWVMPDELTKTLGPVYGNRLLDALGNGPSRVFEIIEKYQIECEATRQGTLHCAVGQSGLSDLRQRASQWQARGIPVQLLSASETATKLGTGAYTGSLLDPRAGTIQPLSYARGLARAAINAGAEIFTASPVTEISRVGDKWVLRTAKGRLTAAWVIMATDAYTEKVMPEIRAEQTFLPYFNFATAPLPAHLRDTILPERQGAWDTKEVLTSFRMDKAGRVIFGSVGALTGTGISVHRSWAKRSLNKLFPKLGPVDFEVAWHGKIGLTTDFLPRFHRFGPNMIGTSGYNGRGISPGTVFGKALADHIGGQLSDSDLPLPLSDVGKPAFRRTKEAIYEIGAQAVHFTGARF